MPEGQSYTVVDHSIKDRESSAGGRACLVGEQAWTRELVWSQRCKLKTRGERCYRGNQILFDGESSDMALYLYMYICKWNDLDDEGIGAHTNASVGNP